MRLLLGLISSVLVLAACSDAGPPPSPPTLTAPPPVATDGFETAFAQATVPMTVPQLRRYMEDAPLISFLKPTDSISNPVASQVLEGTCPMPGAARWLRLADGHYVIERVLENRPEFFKYQVFIFTNAAGRGVEQIVGEQRFVAVEDGTRFEWTYNVRPRNALTRLFVRRNMPEIESYISGGLSRFAEDATRAATGS